MQTLWLAIFLYSVGLGIVLQVRPSLMFQTNGAWKEFGYQRGSRYTLMPVWLFAIVWAIVSYAIASAIGAFAVGGAIVAAYNYEEELPPPFEDVIEENVDFEIPVSQMPEPVRRPRGRPRKTPYPSPFQPSNNFLTPETSLNNQNISAAQFQSQVQATQIQSPVQATQIQSPVQPQTTVQPQPRPGYYVLDPTSETNGLRRYIYFGSTPPPDAKEVVINSA